MEVTPTQEDLKMLVETLQANELAKQKRAELSKESFDVWFQDIIRSIALKLGYTIQQIVEFIHNLGYAFELGFEKGRNLAKQRGDLRRKQMRRDIE